MQQSNNQIFGVHGNSSTTGAHQTHWIKWIPYSFPVWIVFSKFLFFFLLVFVYFYCFLPLVHRKQCNLFHWDSSSSKLCAYFTEYIFFPFNRFSLCVSFLHNRSTSTNLNIFSEFNLLLNQEADLVLRMVRIVRFGLLIHYLCNLYDLKTQNEGTHNRWFLRKTIANKIWNSRENSHIFFFLNVTIYNHRLADRQHTHKNTNEQY